MTERIDEIESRLREMAQPQQPADADGPALRPPSDDQAESQAEPEATPETAPQAEPQEEAPQPQHAAGEVQVPDGYSVLSGGIDGRRAVAIVVSKFNGEITNRLLERALAELDDVGVPHEAVMIMPVMNGPISRNRITPMMSVMRSAWP